MHNVSCLTSCHASFIRIEPVAEETASEGAVPENAGEDQQYEQPQYLYLEAEYLAPEANTDPDSSSEQRGRLLSILLCRESYHSIFRFRSCLKIHKHK